MQAETVTDIDLEDLTEDIAEGLTGDECEAVGHGDGYFGRPFWPPCYDRDRRQFYVRGFARGLCKRTADSMHLPDSPH